MIFYIFWKKYKFLRFLVGANLKHLPIKNNDLHFRIRILYFDPQMAQDDCSQRASTGGCFLILG